jgi:hypothetical protein
VIGLKNIKKNLRYGPCTIDKKLFGLLSGLLLERYYYDKKNTDRMDLWVIGSKNILKEQRSLILNTPIRNEVLLYNIFLIFINLPELNTDRFDPLITYVPGNIIFCCSECNDRKHDSRLSDWKNFLRVANER